MNNVNSTALFRSLIVYAICVPLAIIVGWTLTNPLDYQSVGFIGALSAFLVFPLLMRWHYPLLVFSWAAPVTVFLLPGRPQLFLPMVIASLSISVVERILNKEKQFLPAASVRWSLVTLLAVVVFTAEMTGGFGFRSMGSEVYGGKKYAVMIIGILSFFAITARPIPIKYANRYVALFFLGPALYLFSDLYPLIPDPLHFFFLILPMSDRALDEMGNYQMEFGVTRMFGVATAAGSVFYWMLARYGIRGIFAGGKPWRPLLLGLMLVLILTGGFRSALLGALMIFGLLFYLERLHRTGLLLVILMLGVLGSALIVPIAPHLPFTFQRSLAWLPLDINPDARMDAEASTEWRLNMWNAVLPLVPKYLLVGKGFSFSAQTFNDSMGRNATFKAVDIADEGYALSSDFHSGPLQLLIGFGIWGVLAWLWYLAAGFWVVWRNYRYGDRAVQHLNLFFFAYFVSKVLNFFFIFGTVVDDVGAFAGIIGLSIAINHGVRRPSLQAKPSPVAARPTLGMPIKQAFQR